MLVPPDIWSSWKTDVSHTGSVGYNIKAWPETVKGGTALYSQVRFYNTNGESVVYDFDDGWFSYETGIYVPCVNGYK